MLFFNDRPPPATCTRVGDKVVAWPDGAGLLGATAGPTADAGAVGVGAGLTWAELVGTGKTEWTLMAPAVFVVPVAAAGGVAPAGATPSVRLASNAETVTVTVVTTTPRLRTTTLFENTSRTSS